MSHHDTIIPRVLLSDEAAGIVELAIPGPWVGPPLHHHDFGARARRGRAAPVPGDRHGRPDALRAARARRAGLAQGGDDRHGGGP